jgi:DNA-binding HxlR family transcriptional regulator
MSEPPPFTCGLSAALAVVGGKWKPLIIYFLLQET